VLKLAFQHNHKQENDSSTMIKLRLKRYGKKREASYRIIAINNLARRDGRPLEELGFYNPRTDEVRLDVPGIVKRLQQGAQPTDTVRRILVKANVFEQVSATTAAS
jgi:small subunit ribosomal protein S16